MGLGETIGIIAVVIVIFTLLFKYARNIKAIAKAVFFSFIISIVIYWLIVLFVANLPPISLVIFMLALIVLNLVFHRDEG